MRFLKAAVALLAGLALVNCGGGKGDVPTDGEPQVQVGDLILELSKASVANTGSDSVIATVTVLDAARNTIAAVPVQVSADSDAIVNSPSSSTGADGKLQSTLTIGANRSNRVITMTVSAGSVSKTAEVQVFGAKLTGTLVPTVVAPSGSGKVQFRLVDQAGTPMVNESVQVVATGFTPAEAIGTTGSNGDYEFSYTSAPGAQGSYEIGATAGGATTDPPLVVQVQPTSTIPPVGATITSSSVSANPSVVGTNLADSTANRSEIRALFLTSNNQPVANVRVKFDLAGDANSIGGSFTTGRETLYSDANGVVTTAYVPGTRSSPTNGVTVRACFYLDDAQAAADPYNANGTVTTCANADTVTLTVTAEPLGVSIGTNELIIPTELTYIKKFIVSVVDSAGRAKPDVDLVVSIDLPQYRKGAYAVVGDKWFKTPTITVDGEPVGTDRAICPNEDTNRNGVLETGEDVDNDVRLDPGKSDVSISLLQAKTRADGTAELQIQYPKNFGSWVDAKITVSASGVSGTEGRASYLLAPVPVDAASIGNTDVAPAYVVSPYGVIGSCTNPN